MQAVHAPVNYSDCLQHRLGIGLLAHIRQAADQKAKAATEAAAAGRVGRGNEPGTVR